VLFISPATVQTAILALLLGIGRGGVLALQATALASMGEEICLVYLAGVGTVQLRVDLLLAYN